MEKELVIKKSDITNSLISPMAWHHKIFLNKSCHHPYCSETCKNTCIQAEGQLHYKSMYYYYLVYLLLQAEGNVIQKYFILSY